MFLPTLGIMKLGLIGALEEAAQVFTANSWQNQDSTQFGPFLKCVVFLQRRAA